MKLKSKKAETLSESVVSIAIFGILLLGITDFMSAQMRYVARNQHRDELIYKAQELVASDDFRASFSTKKNSNFTLDLEQGYKVVWSQDKKILTIKDNVEELTFALP